MSKYCTCYVNNEAESILVMTDKPEMTIDDVGNKYWLNYKCLSHREDGPAVEYANGTKLWFINGKQHREDGPAVEYADGSKYWYVDGKLHRTDGPAVECTSGTKLWFLNGEIVPVRSQEEFERCGERLMKLKAFW